MSTIKKAYPISKETWIEIGSEYPVPDDYPEKYRGQTLIDVAIGVEGDGETQQYIIEPFFPALLPLIFEKKLKVHVNLYADPAVVVEKDNRIVLHNADIETIKIELDKIVNNIAESNRIHAMTEIRKNMYNRQRIGATTKTVRNKLTQLLPKNVLFDDKKLNYDFLKLYLFEKYNIDKKNSGNELAEIVRSFSKEELLNIHSCIIEMDNQNETWYEPGASLLKRGYTLDEIKNSYYEELAYRFYTGDLT